MLANEYILAIYAGVISCSIFGALCFGSAGLTSLMSVFLVLVNLLVTKHITLFGLTATAADPLVIGIPLTLNLLQEYYGPQTSKRAIWISFYMAFVYMIISILHLWYTPSPADTSHTHFYALLAPMPRLVIASFTTFIVAQYTDWYLYRALRPLFSRKFAFLPTYISTSISQAVDTVTFALLGLYGIMHNLHQIILVSYTIKMITLLGTAPFTLVIQSIYSVITRNINKG